VWPSKDDEQERRAAAEAKDAPFDAFAGGYPVPPLPGQVLPPSHRRRMRETVAVSGPSSAGAGTGPTTEEDAPSG